MNTLVDGIQFSIVNISFTNYIPNHNFVEIDCRGLTNSYKYNDKIKY